MKFKLLDSGREETAKIRRFCGRGNDAKASCPIPAKKAN
jgi:hypothetical protein